MLTAYSDDRPSPVVGALGAIALLTLIAGVVLAFQRSGDSDLPSASAVGPGRIVFASDREDDLDIYAMNADGSGRVQLTDSRSVDSYPSWSPDGS